ncbi:hypothetical protein GWI34_18420 [Actinomadura sp. DSM 109109]|nr:hypothetical protein [Actinomadura lepetitiana]
MGVKTKTIKIVAESMPDARKKAEGKPGVVKVLSISTQPGNCKFRRGKPMYSYTVKVEKNK